MSVGLTAKCGVRSPRPATAMLAMLALLAVPAAIPAGAQAPGPGLFAAAGDRAARSEVPRQVQLIIEPGRLLASNIRLGRFDEWLLDDGETVLQTADANAVLAAVTSTRILAYGPVIGWREIALEPGEQVEALEAEDYALFVATNRRYLNFSADTGRWAVIVR